MIATMFRNRWRLINDDPFRGLNVVIAFENGYPNGRRFRCDSDRRLSFVTGLVHSDSLKGRKDASRQSFNRWSCGWLSWRLCRDAIWTGAWRYGAMVDFTGRDRRGSWRAFALRQESFFCHGNRVGHCGHCRRRSGQLHLSGGRASFER